MRRFILLLILVIISVCLAVKIESGDVSRNVYFVAVDSTDYIARETSLTSPTVYYSIDGGSATAMTTPTITAVDTTNMPGVFKLAVDESGMVTLSVGVEFAELVVHIEATEMAPVTMSVEVYDGFTSEITEILADTTIIADANNNTEAKIDVIAALIADVNTNIIADTSTIADVNSNLAALIADVNSNIVADIASLPTAANVVDEFESQSQSDPTGFHVNVKEVNGTAQTANDNGADINAILADTEIIADANSNLTEDIANVVTILGLVPASIENEILDATMSGHVTAGTVGYTIYYGYTNAKAVNDLTKASGAGDLAAILTDTSTTIPASITTAQNDLDILTGTDGATLATSQPNYAPNVVVPDEAGTAPTAAEIVTAIKESTGYTQGGTYTFADLIKIISAWNIGKWQDKDGESGTYEVLDAEDGETVILEVTPSETSPQKTVVVQ